MTNEIKSDIHNWELNKCPWCRKPHVKYPMKCVQTAIKLTKKYKADKPKWIGTLIDEMNDYIESFRKNMKG